MKTFNLVSILSDPKYRSWVCSLLVTASLFCCIYFSGNVFFVKDYSISPGLAVNYTTDNLKINCVNSEQMPKISEREVSENISNPNTDSCQNKCRPVGTESLPEGILDKTSNMEMRPMWGPIKENRNPESSKSLLAIAVGMKQKKIVNQIIEKFLANEFVVMLFHYDGIVDEWNDLEWSRRVIHISAMNQTKWWFAKRFLHPDIVAEYEYIFLWDEDLIVENFHPGRYLSIIKSEGLEISQPALDWKLSEVHHQITARMSRSKVHRRYFKFSGGGRCNSTNTAPPCVGWVEMMAPVFSRAAWQCSWYMIQNDLIHAWGLDMLLGYCAQGDRTKNVGVVDSEYVIHLGLPTLGAKMSEAIQDSTQTKPDSVSGNIPDAPKVDARMEVRKQSYMEMKIFRRRWNSAVKQDKCWIDPYLSPDVQTSS